MSTCELNDLTAERLRSTLDYNPETGVFTWKVGRRRVKKGSIAGSPNTSGYRYIKVDGRRYIAHRLAWLYYYNEWPKGHLDHKDRNRANNAISNLRECTFSENPQNSTRSRGSSKYRGVCWCKRANKWVARISVNNKVIYLGVFDDELEAANAYKQAKEKYHPFYWKEGKST